MRSYRFSFVNIFEKALFSWQESLTVTIPYLCNEIQFTIMIVIYWIKVTFISKLKHAFLPSFKIVSNYSMCIALTSNTTLLSYPMYMYIMPHLDKLFLNSYSISLSSRWIICGFTSPFEWLINMEKDHLLSKVTRNWKRTTSLPMHPHAVENIDTFF